MNSALQSLPEEAEKLKELVLRQAAELETLAAENRHQKVRISALQEQLNLLLHKCYGASSEKAAPGQLGLFDEAEATVAEGGEPEEENEEQAETVQVSGYSRQKRGRRPLPENLPRVEVIHDLPEEEKVCTEGHRLVEIGRETSEQLDIIPAKVQVIRHVRIKYACRCCQAEVKTAPLPPQPIPKSMASPGLLAHVAVSKYQDALPLYRQEQMFRRIGVDLPRITLAAWMIRMGVLLMPLINLLRAQLLSYDIVQMDETTVQVLKEPGKPATSKSYMWVQKGGPPNQAIVLYEYDPSRSQKVPERLLEGFAGYLQTDGYEGYGAVAARPDIVQVGCFAHARRKFDEAIKAQSKGKPKPGKATKGLAYIQKLYRIEQEIKDAASEERYRVRQAKAKPLLAEIRAWLDQSLPQVPPTSAVGKALHYLHNQWDKLIRYCDDGRLNIDNNPVERAIRPFVTGRKNWLFADTVKGAQASAALYSLIETAKANRLEPYAYLRHVFKELPAAQTLDDLETLLPYNVDADNINPITGAPVECG